MIKTMFYDIESLRNVFTLCNFDPVNHCIYVYYLCDDLEPAQADLKNIADNIRRRNKNFTGVVKFRDLHKPVSCIRLANAFGLSNAAKVNDPHSFNIYAAGIPGIQRFVCDTDPGFTAEKYPYMFGYNSDNYDLTMLAVFFDKTFQFTEMPYDSAFGASSLPRAEIHPVTAAFMRKINDTLFSEVFKDSMPSLLLRNITDRGIVTGTRENFGTSANRIRRNFLMSGRHLDVAKLNEKQQHVGLKRLCGMLGLQIMESDKLKPDTDEIRSMDELSELVAYNASDCINLEKLFLHNAYHAPFELKSGLLKTYPELVYEKRPDAYKPNISPETVRNDRLLIDSSSAKFASMTLCPYGRLDDIPTVSFMYPSEQKSKELGIPRVNVLEELKKFYYAKFPQPEIRAQFDRIYNYYKQIEGRNFNKSDSYKKKYGENAIVDNWPEKTGMCIPYYNKDGTPSSCYAQFSVGGIHGAEYNKALYEKDMAAYQKAAADLAYVKSVYPNPGDMFLTKIIKMPDGRKLPHTEFVKSGGSVKAGTKKYKTLIKPELFAVLQNGSTRLNPKYVFTSADDTNHEDFKSYYPNMLRMLSAFYNPGLGYDRYAEIYENKEKYGKLMKDKSLSDEEREHYHILREGTKLILNSASGAGDANFESPIRMNNRIISMRVIGQCFTFRIGQAQTCEGAKIISTNTDGLYSVMRPAELNNAILARESTDIGVAIEPESLYLISKDSNNRIELNGDGSVASASGGTLACLNGPDPRKALAHAAVEDWVLTQYLIQMHSRLNQPCDRNAVLAELQKAADGDAFRKRAEKNGLSVSSQILLMFQTIAASSPGSNTYIYGIQNGKAVILQRHNRIFIMKDDTTGSDVYHLMSARLRKNDVKSENNHDDPAAVEILKANGVKRWKPDEVHAVMQKVTGIDPVWNIRIENHNLEELTEAERQKIISGLDLDKYADIICDKYEDCWRNH